MIIFSVGSIAIFFFVKIVRGCITHFSFIRDELDKPNCINQTMDYHENKMYNVNF